MQAFWTCSTGFSNLGYSNPGRDLFGSFSSTIRFVVLTKQDCHDFAGYLRYACFAIKKSPITVTSHRFVRLRSSSTVTLRASRDVNASPPNVPDLLCLVACLQVRPINRNITTLRASRDANASLPKSEDGVRPIPLFFVACRDCLVLV